MGVPLNVAGKLASAYAKARLPVLFRGKHGIGKSEMIKQIAADLDLPVVEIRLSQMTEGDMLGIPFVEPDADGTKFTKFFPMHWLATASMKPVLLLLDEIDRAINELKQGAFQLMDSRQLNGVRLHPDTIVMAAINGGEYGKYYQVQSMEPAELSRYSVIDIEPLFSEWVAWGEQKKNGKQNIIPEILAFLKDAREHWDHKTDFTADQVYPCPRSWKRFSDVLSVNKWIEEANFDLIRLSGYSFIGMGASHSFEKFIKEKRTINLKDFYNGKYNLDEFDRSLLDQVYTKFILEQKQNPSKLSDLAIKNVCELFVRLDSEYLISMLDVIFEQIVHSCNSMDEILESNLVRFLMTEVSVPEGFLNSEPVESGEMREVLTKKINEIYIDENSSIEDIAESIQKSINKQVDEDNDDETEE